MTIPVKSKVLLLAALMLSGMGCNRSNSSPQPKATVGSEPAPVPAQTPGGPPASATIGTGGG